MICSCGHADHSHSEGRCRSDDPAINRNWCDCARFTPVKREEAVLKMAKRYEGYWFMTPERALEWAEKMTDR